MIFGIYAQVTKPETKLMPWHAMCILALGTARINDFKRHIECDCLRTKAGEFLVLVGVSRPSYDIIFYFI